MLIEKMDAASFLAMQAGLVDGQTPRDLLRRYGVELVADDSALSDLVESRPDITPDGQIIVQCKVVQRWVNIPVSVYSKMKTIIVQGMDLIHWVGCKAGIEFNVRISAKVLPRVINKGGVVVIQGSGAGASETINIDFGATVGAATTTSDVNGDFLASYIVPSLEVSGTKVIRMKGVTSGVDGETQVKVK